MAGFFSLGGRGAGPHSNKEEEEERVVEKHHHHHHNNSSLFLFRNNDEVYNNKGGFEIWPQPYHQNQGLSNYYSFGVGPSSRRNNNNNNNDNSNNNSNEEDVSFCVSDESTRFGLTVMRSSSGGGGTASGGVNCQDCGNQAKKDCAHLRCRTCCKSRGFQCQTHVKSTWVPAAKRRERQQQLAALQQQQLRSDTCSKRHRDNQQALVDTLPCPPHVPTITTTGLELGQFPSEVSSSAVFRCVKVSAIDSPDEQYAYQTAVNIGGHLFKGILYDQGPQGPYTTAIVAEGSSAGGGGGTETHHQQQQLSLITASTTAATGNPFDPSSSSLYPAPLNAFMAGTQFFPPPRS